MTRSKPPFWNYIILFISILLTSTILIIVYGTGTLFIPQYHVSNSVDIEKKNDEIKENNRIHVEHCHRFSFYSAPKAMTPYPFKNNFKDDYYEAIHSGNFKKFKLLTNYALKSGYNLKEQCEFSSELLLKCYYPRKEVLSTLNINKILFMNNAYKLFLKQNNYKYILSKYLKEQKDYLNQQNILKSLDFSYYLDFLDEVLYLKDWSFPQIGDFKTSEISILVGIDKKGRLVSTKLLKSCGNSKYDRSAEQFIKSIFPLKPFEKGAKLNNIDIKINFDLKTNTINESLYLNDKFQIAVEKGDLESAKNLLAQGVNVYSYGYAMKKAVDNNDLNMVKLLIENNYKLINDTCGNDYSYIIDNGSLSIFKYATKKLMEQKLNFQEEIYRREGFYRYVDLCYTPFEDILATHDIKKVKYIKSLGIDFSQKDYEKRIKKVFNELNSFPVLLKLIHFGYPSFRKFRDQHYVFIITDSTIRDYIKLEPVECFETTFQVYKEYSNKLPINKDFIFKAMENYLKALLEVNYQEVVVKNKDEYSYADIVFKNEAIEKRGFVRLDGNSFCEPTLFIRENTKGCENKLDEKTAYEEHIWTLKKFFYRRGEFLGNLCIYYALKILDFEKDKNKEALRLYITYGKELQNKYNTFIINWNKGILPISPIEELAKQLNPNYKYTILDLKSLKSRYKTLPLSTLSFRSYKNIKPLKKSLYVNNLTPLDYYFNEIEKINKKEDYLNALNTYLSDDDLNGGNTNDLALKLILKAKNQDMPKYIIERLLDKYLYIDTTYSMCNYYDCIETEREVSYSNLCNFGLFEEALDVFNNNCDYCKREIKEKDFPETYGNLPFSKVKNQKLIIELPFQLKNYFKKQFTVKIFDKKLPIHSQLANLNKENINILDSRSKQFKLTITRSKHKLYGYYKENHRVYRLKGFIGTYGNFVMDKYKGTERLGTFVGYFDSPNRIKGYYRPKSLAITDYFLEHFPNGVNSMFIGVTQGESMESFINKLKQTAINE